MTWRGLACRYGLDLALAASLATLGVWLAVAWLGEGPKDLIPLLGLFLGSQVTIWVWMRRLGCDLFFIVFLGEALLICGGALGCLGYNVVRTWQPYSNEAERVWALAGTALFPWLVLVIARTRQSRC